MAKNDDELKEYAEEFPEEEPLLEEVKMPEYKLIDVIREFKTVRNDINVFLEQVKALGSEVVKNNEEVLARLEIQNSDFHEIKDAIVYGLANLARPQTAVQQPQTAQQVTRQTSLPSRGQIIQHLRDLGVPQDGLTADIEYGKMVIRLPYMDNKTLFAKSAGYLQKDLGMEYVKERKNNRFVQQ